MTIYRQPSVAQAMQEVGRHLYLHAQGAHILPRVEGDNAVVELQIDVANTLGLGQTMQMSVGQLGNFTRELIGLAEPAFTLRLKQSRPGARPPEAVAGMGARLRFGSSIDGVEFPAAWMNRKPRWDEEQLDTHLQNYLGMLRARYPGSLPDQIKDVIGQLLPSGECSLEFVASTLDLQPRVLQMRLRELGTSYGELLRQERQEIAEQHLRFSPLSITDLALKLGFAEVSVFSRSFKQWTGYSPRQWQQHQSEQGQAE